MSWSFSVNENMQDYTITDDLAESMRAVDARYPLDMEITLRAAKAMGLKSGTLSGFRTSSPYGGPESVGLSVMGTIEPVNWQETVRRNIGQGPDCVHEWGPRATDPDENEPGAFWYACVKCGQRQGGSWRPLDDN